MSFKLWTTDTPQFIKELLPTFHTSSGYNNMELVTVAERLGISQSARLMRRLMQFWYALGILDREKETSGAYRYTISYFGDNVLDSIQFGATMTYDLIHWSMYSAWIRIPNFEWGWSWLYRETCDEVWESSPGEIAVKRLQAALLERANHAFPELSPTFDVNTIRAVASWLSALEPPFLVKAHESSKSARLLSRKRERCSPELLFLSLQLQYTLRGLPFGTPLLMDEELIAAVCRVCMLDSAQFWPMAELCGLMFPSLTRKETAYGTSLTVSEAAPFTPPLPRGTGTTS